MHDTPRHAPTRKPLVNPLLFRLHSWSLAVSAVATLLLDSQATAQAERVDTPDAEEMLQELGCASCHADLKTPTTLRDRTPDLSSAGLRYNPAYLFEYLQEPKQVHRHLGRARMPDFHLSSDEALALVLFLSEQRQTTGEWPELPPAVSRTKSARQRILSKAEFRKLTTEQLKCMNCHTLDAKGGGLATELAQVGYRLQRDWAESYLAHPAIFGVAPSAMPPQLYDLTEDRKGYRQIVPKAAEKIELVTDFLFAQNLAKRESLQKSFDAARAASPRIDAAMGESIFRSLNCAACHRHSTIQPRRHNAAPELAGEGRRVSTSWLKRYLTDPHAIRPFGNRPGDGSRMPRFRFSDPEATAIAEYLASQVGKSTPARFQPQKLSAFAMRKARLLLRDKLSCRGCHKLGESGGRIGPDLSSVASRLQPDYVYRMITRPRSVVPHTVMPRLPLTEKKAKLITNYLLQASATLVVQPTEYLSLIANPATLAAPRTESTTRTASHLYLTSCASCHGAAGRGDGFNAQFMPVRPTAHADSKYMAKRPDDTLFDGVHVGGYILNKSHLMPGWGLSLSTREIRGLVSHMRSLCDCKGPEWSRKQP